MAKQGVDSEELNAQTLMAAILEARQSVASLPSELRQQLEFGFCRAEEEGQMIAHRGVWTGGQGAKIFNGAR